MSVRIHPSAMIEAGVEIGCGTAVWDSVHIRAPSRIGRDCIIGEKTYIAYDVEIEDRVKINAFVYVCAAVRIECGVMIAAGTIFTNDLFPRAASVDLASLRSSAPDEGTRPTRVCSGATIGAGCVIGSDLRIGRFAMVGMGAVVTRSVPDFHLVLGNPARRVGIVCRCGHPVLHFPARWPGEAAAAEAAAAESLAAEAATAAVCDACGLAYEIRGGRVIELTPPSPLEA